MPSTKAISVLAYIMKVIKFSANKTTKLENYWKLVDESKKLSNIWKDMLIRKNGEA